MGIFTQLYHASGAQDLELLSEHFAAEEWLRFREQLVQLLEAREQTGAIRLLDRMPFVLFDGTNGFRDEFVVLHAWVPLEDYVRHAALAKNPAAAKAATKLAVTITEIGPYVRFVTFALDTRTAPVPVPAPAPQITTRSVERALNEAEQLLRTGGAASALDRAHTALHGYLKVVCARAQIPTGPDDAMTSLFKRIRMEHPAFRTEGPHDPHVGRIVGAMATVLDALNPLRNRASMAHANDDLLDEPEAMLALNSARALLHYLDAKLH